LQAHGFVDGLLDDGQRLHQHAYRFQFGRDAHRVLLFVDHEFGLVAVQSPDASLAIFAGLTHVGTAHPARGAVPASTPHSKRRIVADFYPGYGGPGAHHLAEHLMPDNEFLRTIRDFRAASRYLFPVGTANPHAQDPELYLICRHQGWFRPFHDSCSRRTWNNCNCFHESAFLAT
jgi:hypothetical protein